MKISPIRELCFDDEGHIIELIKVCIQHGDDLHIANLLPSAENVESFFKFEIFPIMFEDDPIFGQFFGEKLVGISCSSTKVNKIYKLKEKTAMGIVTMVDPDFRREGVGSNLRLAVNKELKSRGFARFIFEIKCENEASLENAKKIAEKLEVKSQLISFKFSGV